MQTKYTDEHHSHFEEHGYVRLGRLLSDADLEALCQRLDDLMLGHIDANGITFQLDGDSADYGSLSTRTVGPSEKTLAYRRVYELHLDPLFLSYMQHPVFRQLTQRYIGEDVSVFRSMLMNKPADKGTVLPWHQDIGVGWGLDGNPITTVWTALDDATVATGCMQIVPGSHKLGIVNETHYISEEDPASYCTDDQILDLEVKAGEAVLLHNWLMHRSGVNETGQARRAFSAAYMDASTKKVRSGGTFPVIFGKDALSSQVA